MVVTEFAFMTHNKIYIIYKFDITIANHPSDQIIVLDDTFEPNL